MKSRTRAVAFFLCLGAAVLGSGPGGWAQAEIHPADGETPSALGRSATDGALRRGYSYLEAGNYAMALAEFDRALREAGDDPVRLAQAHGATGYAWFLQQRGRSGRPEGLGKALAPALARLQLALDLAAKGQDRRLEAWVRISRGLVLLEAGRKEQSAEEFRRGEALATEARDAPLKFQARVQLARLEADPTARLALLRTLAAELGEAPLEGKDRVNLWLNILDQLKQLRSDEPPESVWTAIRKLDRPLAEKTMEAARQAGLARDRARAAGFLADAYEAEGRRDEALLLAEQTLLSPAVAAAPDLGIEWQSRLGRLLADKGEESQAAEAYRRAAYQVSQIRSSIPIYYPNGTSSYRETLEPIYRGLADLLLREAGRDPAPERQQALRLEAMDSLERLKQTELEDYFNDRCAFDSDRVSGMGRNPGRILPDGRKAPEFGTSLARTTGKTVILYPVIFDDRLELLWVHHGKIRQRTVPVTRATITQRAEKLARLFRHGQDYRIPSRELYQWLMQPVAEDFRAAGIQRIVYLPDGALRLVPLGALNSDGRDFVTRHYTVITNSGLKNAPQGDDGSGGVGRALLGGVSKPSEDLLKDSRLPPNLLASLVAPLAGGRDGGGTSDLQTAVRGTPEFRAAASAALALPEVESEVDRQRRATAEPAPSREPLVASAARTSSRGAGAEKFELGPTGLRVLRGSPEFRAAATEALALPEVEVEIDSLHRIVPETTTLLNQTFTHDNLKQGFRSGRYQVAHISTHSYFGHSADESFIMAFDEILTVKDVEDILKPAEDAHRPIELVTFSACETAQGDDRAPLGFSGLALKAKAINAIGALWPINDQATRHFMEAYYSALEQTGGDKADALQQAQLAMLESKNFAHPSFWAPFILVGAW